MRQDCVRREMTTELVVGVFVLVVLMALGAFTILLSRENIFKKRTEFVVTFTAIGNLRDGDNVVVRGVPVGKVRRLELVPGGVRVVSGLEKAVRLHEGYRIQIISTSVLGGRYMLVDEGPLDAPHVRSGAPLVGTEPVDLMQEASVVIRDIRSALDEGKVLENIREAVAELRAASEKLNSGEGILARLLNDGKLAADATAAVEDLKAAASSLKGIAAGLEGGEGTLGRLLHDEKMASDIGAVAENARTLSDRLAKGEGTLGRLLSSDDTLYTDLAAAVASLKDVSGRLERGEGTLGKLLSEDDALYRELTGTVSSLRVVAARLETGEGSLGKILADESLYTEVKSAVEEIRAAIDDYRETSPVVSFSQVLFGAF